MGRSRKIVVVIAALAMLAIPVSGVFANHYFDDVATSAFYHDAVTAVANAGITAGCNQAQTKYCPNSAVTRGQMAVFLDILGNLRGAKFPVVDAFTLFGQLILNDTETFALAGTPTATECLESTHPLPLESDIPYTVTAQLTDAPVDTSTVNVSVDDPDPEDEVFDVCFTLIDPTGTGTLPLGDYDTSLSLTLFVGSGVFAGADARPSVTSFVQSWKN